jgi:hypothetical protein
VSARSGRIAAALTVLAPGALEAPDAGIAGVTGGPRARDWDAFASAEIPELTGDEVHFVALADGTLVVDEDVPDGSLAPLADALETQVEPPYAALGIRRDGTWTAAALQVAIAEVGAWPGDEVEASCFQGERTISVDGEPADELPAALERLGAAAGPDWTLRGMRIDDTLWVVDVRPL